MEENTTKLSSWEGLPLVLLIGFIFVGCFFCRESGSSTGERCACLGGYLRFQIVGSATRQGKSVVDRFGGRVRPPAPRLSLEPTIFISLPQICRRGGRIAPERAQPSRQTPRPRPQSDEADCEADIGLPSAGRVRTSPAPVRRSAGAEAT